MELALGLGLIFLSVMVIIHTFQISGLRKDVDDLEAELS